MKQPKNPWVVAGEYSGIAFLLPTTTFVGYAFGYWLDKKFGTHYWYLVFLLIGIVAGFIQLFRKLKQDSNDQRP